MGIKNSKKTHHEQLSRQHAQTGFHDSVINFYDKFIRELNKKVAILDLGAGSGLVAKSLSEKEYTKSVIAYDRNLECMRELVEHPKIIKSIDGSVYNLPFKNDTFDVIICRFAFHHFENKPKVIDEIIRTLKSNSLFLYSDPVLPDYCKNIVNPLYYIREDNFYGYLGYFETIEMFNRPEFSNFICRPYKYIYESFQQYLEGVDFGFSSEPPIGFSECLKAKLERGWGNLDKITRKEMGIEDSSKRITYQLLDIAMFKK
jgi:ubiquinone/menaquinone biosynthesis C-methylase UbiE